MKYPINLSGFEGQKLEVQSPGIFAGAKLLVDGEPAPKGKKWGEMTLHRNDGKEVVARFQGGFMDVPRLNVDGNVIQIVEPLKWYQWIWNALPLVIVVGGGAIPFLIAFLAFTLNLSQFRNRQSSLAKYSITGAITLGAIVLYLVLAVGLAAFFN